MDRQTVLLIALAALGVAGLTVSITGWMHFVRERNVEDGEGGEVTDAADGGADGGDSGAGGGGD